jgi:hypothetical protein
MSIVTLSLKGMKAKNQAATGTNSRCTNEKGLAAVLQKSPRYVRNLADEKIIPYIALPGRDRIYDIERVMEALRRFEVKAVGQ